MPFDFVAAVRVSNGFFSPDFFSTSNAPRRPHPPFEERQALQWRVAEAVAVFYADVEVLVAGLPICRPKPPRLPNWPQVKLKNAPIGLCWALKLMLPVEGRDGRLAHSGRIGLR